MLIEQFESVLLDDRVRQHIVGNAFECGLSGFLAKAVRESNFEVLSLPHRGYFLVAQSSQGTANCLALWIEHRRLHRYIDACFHELSL